MTYFDICNSGTHPNNLFSDINLNIEKRKIEDNCVLLGPKAKQALKDFQTSMKQKLFDSKTNDYYDDMMYEMDTEELYDVCKLLDRKNGKNTGILLRYADSQLDSYDHRVHLFQGRGLTVCGLKTGEVFYLMGEHTYCKKCFNGLDTIIESI